MSKTLITSRDPKGRQATNIFEAAYNDSRLDDDRAQKLNERGDELKEGVMKLIQELAVSNKFASEEVESNYGYLSGYRPKPIVEQIKILRKLFPELGSIDEKLAKADLPLNAEGWFAIPRWGKIASTYGEAVQKVLDLIKQTQDGKFHNYREGKLDSQHLRQHAKTTKIFQAFGDEQESYDILVVPAQFGLNHRGKSVRRAREVMSASEFGLGAFATGIMILTHPERLQHYDDLWIDCAGDEYAPGADDDFSHAPFFYFNDGKFKFDTYRIDYPSAYYGSLSGFVPAVLNLEVLNS